jgi:hypothetical protein
MNKTLDLVPVSDRFCQGRWDLAEVANGVRSVDDFDIVA